MTISGGANIEVNQAIGDDVNNAGYFNAVGSGAGADFSLLSPLACTDLQVDGTTNTKVNSASIGFTASHLRNGLRITSGSGFTTGLYEIQSGPDGNGFMTLDRSPGAVGITGGTARVGGALASVGQFGALISVSSGHTVFVKYNASAYPHSATQNVSGGRVNMNGCFIVGYDTTRTIFNNDANKPTLNATAASMTMYTIGTAGFMGFHNVIFDNSASNASVLFVSIGASGTHMVIRKCIFRRGTNGALTVGSSAIGLVSDCLFDTISGSVAATLLMSAPGMIQRCYFKDISSAAGVQLNAASAVMSLEESVISNFTGNNSAVYVSSSGGMIRMDRVTAQCTGATAHTPFYFSVNNTTIDTAWCLAVGGRGSGGYGFYDNSGTNTRIRLINCAGYDNALGGSSIPAGEVVGMITPTADPFVNSATGDLRLNTATNGGALLKDIGYTFPGSTLNTYSDVGAFDSLAVVGGPVGSNFRGGFING